MENFDSNSRCYDVVQSAISNHPEMNAIFFVAGGANGGIKAVVEAELSDELTIIANDLSPERIEYLKEDTINAIICQQPYEQGYNSIKRLFNCIMNNKSTRGKKIHTNIGNKN